MGGDWWWAGIGGGRGRRWAGLAVGGTGGGRGVSAILA